MDEIEYKLESKNPVLISHAISKVFESIRKKVNEQEESDLSKVPEFKLLLSKRNSADPTLCISVCQALIALVEQKLWDVWEAMSTLTSTLSSTKNYVAVATATSHLLIIHLKQKKNQDLDQLTLYLPHHPFTVILIQDQHSWGVVLNQMKFIMNHRDRQIRESSVDLLRPVFLYILCNPLADASEGWKQQVWQLLIKSDYTLKLQTEIMLWLCTNDANSCTDTNSRILELADVAIVEKNKELCTALLPIVTSLMIALLKYGSDPRPNLDVMSALIDRCDDCAGNITLLLLAEAIMVCPALYLYSILHICSMIVKKIDCGSVYLNVLVASLLKWMAYPSVLCSDALEMARDLINKIFAKPTISNDNSEITNKLFLAFSNSDRYVRLYAEVVRCVNTLTKENMLLWLKNISPVPIDVKDDLKLLLSGLFLQTDDPEITELTCNILVDITRETKSFGSHVLSLVLHKLTKSRSSSESKYLLLVIPELIITKENVPIITHTLDTFLNGEKQLKYFAIELYLRALKKEPRSYRFLSAALIRTLKNDHSWWSDAACAKAIQHICEHHSEHSEKLIPLISQILNRCVDTNSGTASALALKSISALCKSAVIGIRSTWRVLAPKMEKEKRTIVLESLCELFADIPSYPHQCDEEYDKLILDTVTNLWKYVASNDARVVKAALRALASYRLDQIPLNSLPAEFKADLVLPAAYAKNATAEKAPEDVLPYVPATCWIQMLQKVNKVALSAAGDLLIAFVTEEVKSFRSGIYMWPQGEPRNFKYLPEKSVIRAVGEYLRRSGDQRVVTECLRIFAHKYPKPLPNINWSFLEEKIDISREAREYCLLIGCHHATISLSARLFVENCLLKYASTTDSSLLQTCEHLIFYSNLEGLGEAIQPNNLKPFLVATLDYAVEKTTFNVEITENQFDPVMFAFARALKNQGTHEGNCTLLSSMLEKLLDKIDLTQDRFESYFTAALELPAQQLERLTSPKVWWDVTAEKLKNLIAIRAELSVRKRTEIPLYWLHEIVEVTAALPGVRTYFLETMQRVQTKMQFEKFSKSWILDLMTFIQGAVVKLSNEDDQQIDFYCNILIVSTVCLSGVDCMLTRRDELITSQDVRNRLFPQAVAVLADKYDWKHAIPQIMDWLNYMRTNFTSDSYKFVFHSSLVSLRYSPYYKDVWMKYLSTQTAIDI